ncbi:type IIL restriction-modification enzyme MmeI [Flavobacterium sp. DGU11]|uniref:site-specific DNA-methyltransferase (adenine-specific) n=1 Tax=Flavobacterium arundinis TaxID=3139143 RepID=A0ABU9HVJ0_9FLAO
MKSNSGKSFIGSYVLGMGFVLSSDKAKELIKNNPRNKDVLFPYLNGDDLNSTPEQKPSRWVINFFDWDEEKAKSYPDCYEIIEKLVKPERQRWKIDSAGNEIIGTYALRKPLPQKWWIYGEKRPALYKAISELDQVIIIPLVSKYSTFEFSITNTVFMHKLGVLVLNDYHNFALLSSSIHNLWCWKYSSTLGAGTLNYSTTDCFENYPFPQSQKISLQNIGKQYHHHRKYLTLRIQLGLTKIYNLFHSENIQESTDPNDNRIQYLKKHLEKKGLICDYKFVIENIIKLRELQIQIDQAVLAAYEWNDIQLNHGFYDLEYLPENDRFRFTIHPTARKEILKRLLLLNLQRYDEERKFVSLQTNIGEKKQTVVTSKNLNHTLFPED